MRRFLMIGCAVILGTVMQAKADSIDFANQTGPTTFAASSGPQTITEGLATFSGGVILTNEQATTVTGSVYATCVSTLCLGPTLLNPITINFSAPISDLSIVTTDDLAGTYTLTDNLGHTTSTTFGSTNLGLVTLSLTDSGVTSATLTSSDSSFDFAIDSASYIGPATATPEPSAWLLLGTGLLGLGLMGRRKAWHSFPQSA